MEKKLLFILLCPLTAVNVAQAAALEYPHVPERFLAVHLGTWQSSNWSDSEAGLQGRSSIYKKSSFWNQLKWEDVLAIVGIVALVAAFIALLIRGWGKRLGKAIHVGIKTLDRDVVGVDVKCESVQFNPTTGALEVNDLTLMNPNGYAAPYLLKCGKVFIDVDVLSLWTSLGNDCHVEKIECKDVDVLLEKSQTSSNVQDVLNHVKAKRQEDKKPSEAKTQVFLHCVKLTDIAVKLQVENKGHDVSMRFALGDIDFEDFYDDYGASYSDDIAVVLLDSLLKSVVRNVLVKTGESPLPSGAAPDEQMQLKTEQRGAPAEEPLKLASSSSKPKASCDTGSTGSP